MAAGSRAQTEAIVATTISDNDGKRTIERIKFSGC
jgi:hypothetical protein